MPIFTVWILKYVQQCYFKWFWTISSLGAPENQERSEKLFFSAQLIFTKFIVCYISYVNPYTAYANTYHRRPTLLFVNCKWKLNKRKSFCFILESAVVRNEMEVFLRCENYIQVEALTVLDFTMLYVVMRRLLLSSGVSSLVIVNKLITSSEMRAKPH